MGLTRFRGPVYGGKCLLWSWGPFASGSSGGTTATFPTVGPTSLMTVPPYEDWYITEFSASCSTCSSAGQSLILKSEGGSTTIQPNMEAPGNGSTRAQTLATLSPTATSTTWSTWATVTADGGEYEGAWVPAGSSLRVVSSNATILGGLTFQVRGYIRFRNSTRGEGG